MHVWQRQLHDPADCAAAAAEIARFAPTLVLCFGAAPWFAEARFARAIGAACPDALLVGCSDAGQIADELVHDGSLVLTALRFEHCAARAATTTLASMDDSHDAGERLAAALPRPGLRHVLVFGQGMGINGAALTEGLRLGLPAGVGVSGGLAGDVVSPDRRTWTLGPEGCRRDQVVAVGLYGQALRVGAHANGGWEAFGAPRRVTRSERNVLYEIDGEPALDVYRRYLGDYASDLSLSTMLFPLAVLRHDQQPVGLVRTLLDYHRRRGHITLAGDLEPDGYVRLMHTSTDRLVDAAGEAATRARALALPAGEALAGDAVALLVSCNGRRVVMGDRVDEEVTAAAEALGPGTTLCGFYSFGEIAAMDDSGVPHLHNQTMTVTWLGEAPHA